jgi:hypothetical protein
MTQLESMLLGLVIFTCLAALVVLFGNALN